MGMVGELTRRQRELIKIIQNKDKEIDDYKSQGIKTSRSESKKSLTHKYSLNRSEAVWY